MKRIVLTGGGTAGHVTPNLALLPLLKAHGYEVRYIGSKNGMEKQLVEDAGIPYDGISSGKLRRYFDWKNFTDPFRVLKGFGEAKKLLKTYKPDVVFSKGGFVSVPVIFAANKLSIPSAAKICCNFPETLKNLPEGKAIVTGCPIREELLSGSRLKGLEITEFTPDKPVLLIIGGSLGSVAVNTAVRNILPELLKEFQVIHICGKKNVDESLKGTPGYVQYGYVSEELKDLFATADIVISRAGANAICELLALRKPALLIPLSAAASRGDQLLNAESFRKQGFSDVLQEEEITDEVLLARIHHLYETREEYRTAMEKSNLGNAVQTIVELLDSLCEK